MLAPGTHVIGPENGTLAVLTGKGGAAAKAGHNLVLRVGRWSATLEVSEEIALELTADSRSLRVIKGTGGMMPLGPEEKAAIAQTINEDVLEGGEIAFRSSEVEAEEGGARLRVRGQLGLLGAWRETSFELAIGEDGRLAGNARIKQSDWGIKPYSALFGTLKVADVLDVVIDACVPVASPAEATTQGADVG
jgi:hypothetical protein